MVLKQIGFKQDILTLFEVVLGTKECYLGFCILGIQHMVSEVAV